MYPPKPQCQSRDDMGTEQPPAEGAAKPAQWSPKPMAPRFWGVLLMAWRFVRKCPREGWSPFFGPIQVSKRRCCYSLLMARENPERQVSVLLLFLSSIRNSHADPLGLQRQQGPREGEGVCAAQGQMPGLRNPPLPQGPPVSMPSVKKRQGQKG